MDIINDDVFHCPIATVNAITSVLSAHTHTAVVLHLRWIKIIGKPVESGLMYLNNCAYTNTHHHIHIHIHIFSHPHIHCPF